MTNQILYEDNHLLIVNKQPGDIVQGDKTGDEPLVETLKSYLKEKYHKPGEVFLGVVHRLDRPVSGAVVFARTSKALARMNAMMQSREVKKVYWAVSPHPGSLPHLGEGRGGGLLTHYLKRNEQQNKSYAYDLPGEGRQRAELLYRVIAQGDRYDLLEVELLTGRHHQIRAQLAAIGRPIKGDLKYGAPRSNPDGSISLHSRMVEFVHPVSKAPVSITAPLPEEGIWKKLAGDIV
ncbi:MAG TPA: RluA family pseudouridine synthase [Bacteroidales bacterium]|nr:RluA family pseudouridine synthase [Bacteroidales bacterium]HPI87246.1 RluA family pseudouridine synthase [Bacteroidales bacterium]HPM92260.1 RluA family pseudouridine synthase [Bacteroidales bacterium]